MTCSQLLEYSILVYLAAPGCVLNVFGITVLAKHLYEVSSVGISASTQYKDDDRLRLREALGLGCKFS
jgi:hypothetical protein